MPGAEDAADGLHWAVRGSKSRRDVAGSRSQRVFVPKGNGKSAPPSRSNHGPSFGVRPTTAALPHHRSASPINRYPTPGSVRSTFGRAGSCSNLCLNCAM